MKVSLEKQGNNVVELDLELESDKALKAYEVACRQLSHRVNIPGFRRGKAPRKIVEKTLGVSYIKQEALEQLIPEMLQKAITDQNLDIITRPEIRQCHFELGEPLKVQASFEVRPEVSLGQYQGLKISVAKAELKEEALELALKNLAEAKATWKQIEDRPVAMGDTVVLDFECFVDGALVEGGKAQGLILEMKAGNFLEGFCEQLVSLEPGKEREIKAKFPENYRNSKLAGKDGVFKAVVRGIRERALPQIDDELAKQFGAESLERMKELVKLRLEEEIKNENQARTHRALIEEVVKHAQVEIPETMVERERELLLTQVKQVIEQNNQDWSEFQTSPEFEAIKAEKTEEARNRVLTSLVLGAIVRAEKITVSPQELAPYLAEVAARYNVPVERVAKRDEIRQQVTEEVLTQKVVDYLLAHAEVEYKSENETKPEGLTKAKVLADAGKES